MKIEEIVQDVFNVSFSRQRDLAETFLRFSEHYENPEFRGKIFSLDEFKLWYVGNSPKGKKTGKFTYYEDWDGFNVPSHVFEPFYERKFDPLSKKEKKLLDRFEARRGDRFYLIGTAEDANIATKRHEISHGLFYIIPEYRQEVLQVINRMSPEDREKINDFLGEYGGCHPDFFDDETQAYLVDRRCLGANGVSGEGLAKAGKEIKRIFAKFYHHLA